VSNIILFQNLAIPLQNVSRMLWSEICVWIYW